MTQDLDSAIQRPDVIIPDTGPLIHLAQAGVLHLLHEIGGRVVVMDMVAIEATADLGKPGARHIQHWLEAGRAPGSNTPVEVAATDVGRAYVAARIGDPSFRWRGAGELAIVEWLRDRIDHTQAAVIVVYENGKVPKAVGEAGVEADIDILTTRAFLELAERRRIVPSAEIIWRRIDELAPTVNPQNVVTTHRRSGIER